jgi:hypothetical protein
MPEQPSFDPAAAHRYFSTTCFNQAWDFIEKPNRTPGDDEQMLRLSIASLWHWTQRFDCTPENLSVGYWQQSRIYVLLGQTENARHYAQLCLQVSQADGTPLYCLGFAYEALARTEMAAGNKFEMQNFLQKAHQIAERIADPQEKQLLLGDLSTIG